MGRLLPTIVMIDEGSPIIAEDGDCDGTPTAEDCDDADPESYVVAEDGDCDGVLTADDCDDSDPNSHLVWTMTYSTCDGDCDDNDPRPIGGSDNEPDLCTHDADGDGTVMPMLRVPWSRYRLR